MANISSSSSPPDSSHTRKRAITPSDRVRHELNGIDRSVPQLLQAASEALQTLSSTSSATTPTLFAAKAKFIESITTYFTLLSSIDVRLRREVYALQEAGLIAEGDAKDAKRGASSTTARGGKAPTGGQLDVSWLNSRRDQVERAMEGEIWKEARDFVERLMEEKNGVGGIVKPEEEVSDAEA